ncbi:MAG: HAMP domain-containing histidine kinase [Aliarcobacter sp.]|nr:HAMP domain-containing histidine kinase [Aliarcobacter sp.]
MVKRFFSWNRGLQKNSNKIINIYAESIDYKRLKSQMENDDWENYLKKKYKDFKFDGIIIENEIASKILNSFSKKLYADIPKIYISDFNIEQQNDTLQVNNTKKELIVNSIKLAKQNNENLKNIYIIKSYNEIGILMENLLLEELGKEKFNTVIVKDLLVEQTKEFLSKVPKDSAVFYTLNFEDYLGKNYIPKDFLKIIATNSNAPIYSFWNTFIGTGTLGGYQKSAHEISFKSLESIVNKIEKGNFIYDLPCAKLYLDYEVLQKFGIDESKCPSDAIIINKPIPIWKTYPKETFFALSLIILLFLLLLFTYILKLRDKKISDIEKSMFLQAKQAALGDMLSTITHQWKQPLNKISIIVQSIVLKLKKKMVDDIIIDKFEMDVLNQIMYMSNTIDDFTNFNHPRGRKNTFDIKDSILKTIELSKNYYFKKDIKIIFDDLSSFNLNGFSNEISHCILIILQNANYALLNSKNKEKIITISSDIIEEKYIVTIENNGEFIPHNIIKEIFKPYFSTKSEKTNTGLGLYIVKNILEKNFNASIEVSNTSVGVAFKICFNNIKEK